MDETTIQDIKTRVQRWQKDNLKDGKESERTWIFAVNIDDVALMLNEIERLTKENEDLHMQLFQAREHQTHIPSEGNPTGLEKYWFNELTGPYKADDTFQERACRWAHGPYETWDQANVEWKQYIRRQIVNGK